MLNYPTLQFWFNVLIATLNAALFFYTRRVARQKATDERFKLLEERVAKTASANDLEVLMTRIEAGCKDHRGRTGVVEARTAELRIELQHLPTQQQFNELNRSILALNGELKNTQGRLEGINRAVDLMNEFLINQGKA